MTKTIESQGEREFDEVLLERLVALNAERADEEAQGTVRWLRPEFQNPAAPGQVAVQATTRILDQESASVDAPKPATGKQPWPATLPDQVAAITRILAASPTPLDRTAIAACVSGRGKSRLTQILETLAALGRARRMEDGRWMG